MSLYFITLFYSYTQTYYDNISQSTYLQKLAVLPLLNHARIHFVGGAMDCQRENESSVYFFRITIPAFHAGYLKGVTTTGLHLQIYQIDIP